MKTTVIFHSADYDGIFCREIARKFLPDAELIGWDFADASLSVPNEGVIYILDLPVDRVFGLKFGEEGHLPWLERVIWIDHHKSSIETHSTTIPGYRIDGVAASRLAWQWFTATPGTQTQDLPRLVEYKERRVIEPLAVRLAGEYDVWDKRDPRAEVFQFGLRSRELSQFDWNDMLSTKRPTIEEVEALIATGHKESLIEPDGTVIPVVVHQLLESGAQLQRYQQATDAGVVNHRSFVVEFEGLKFLALNTAHCNSLTFAAKDLPETGHDALMGFYYNGKVWTVSLYHASHRKDIDLSVIAVKHGGGGHRGACGFTTASLLPLNWKTLKTP